ncbi:hypothetical protein BDZ91DRAFT_718589 [Kalaharituber pfeilii]|nr:hypothetical protein BDZ91DRAFT_718589 [Kalaharituber pfeilii]
MVSIAKPLAVSHMSSSVRSLTVPSSALIIPLLSISSVTTCQKLFFRILYKRSTRRMFLIYPT